MYLERLRTPAVLGGDKELDQVMETLARAALEVGSGNWWRVKDLKIETQEYPTVRAAPEWLSVKALLPLVVPLIPVVIGGLISTTPICICYRYLGLLNLRLKTVANRLGCDCDLFCNSRPLEIFNCTRLAHRLQPVRQRDTPL
jgi:hypothetical protein